jgi:hypothetical protein
MHDILIGAPRDMQTGNRPAILQRNDDDFIAATLDELRTSPGRLALAARRARATDPQGTLKLFQPIQRQFHVALLEAWCDTPGTPRVDPARIDSAGFVVRRIGASGQPEGWMRSNGRARGWVPLSRVGGAVGDPLSQHRLQRQLTGVADIDRQLTGIRLAQSDNLLDEHSVPLFVAPPDVCSDAAKTVFYGIVPTVSGDVSAATPAGAAATTVDFGPRSELFRAHLVEALRGDAMDLPFAGDAVAGGWSDASDMSADTAPYGVSEAQFSDLTDESSGNSRALRRFLLMLRQLASEFNAFEGEAAAPLRGLLGGIALPLVLRDDDTVQRSVPADRFLDDACRILLMKENLADPVEMPERWPALEPAAAGALADAMVQAMQARAAALQPQSGRYDEPGARYLVRAFVRIKPEGHCPLRIVWSADSEPFVIAPWFENAEARPPVLIPLPDASDRDMLRQLKPNIAFLVPPSMQNLLSGKTKDLLGGKGKLGTMGLTWICGFNIPAITICAFLVLNIFLTLFNLVFGWLFFIKICVPFPKFGNKPPSN